MSFLSNSLRKEKVKVKNVKRYERRNGFRRRGGGFGRVKRTDKNRESPFWFLFFDLKWDYCKIQEEVIISYVVSDIGLTF